MRRPTKPKKPIEPSIKNMGRGNFKIYRIEQGETLDVLMDKINVSDLSRIKILDANAHYGQAIRFHIEVLPPTDGLEELYQQAMMKYQEDLENYDQIMVGFNKKLTDWKAWKVAKLMSEIKELKS